MERYASFVIELLDPPSHHRYHRLRAEKRIDQRYVIQPALIEASGNRIPLCGAYEPLSLDRAMILARLACRYYSLVCDETVFLSPDGEERQQHEVGPPIGPDVWWALAATERILEALNHAEPDSLDFHLSQDGHSLYVSPKGDEGFFLETLHMGMGVERPIISFGVQKGGLGPAIFMSGVYRDHEVDIEIYGLKVDAPHEH